MRQPKIIIVDYEVGNTYSVLNALISLGYNKVNVSKDYKEIYDADAIILPGVGAFDACMTNLRKFKLNEILDELVLVKAKPILGICVGMQLMATSSEENGMHSGLNWINGHVVKLALPQPYLVPHVGWNNVKIIQKGSFFANTIDEPHFYFDHSFHFICDEENIVAITEYSSNIVAAIVRNNIHGVQFHPEKSQVSGLKLFRNFINYVSQC